MTATAPTTPVSPFAPSAPVADNDGVDVASPPITPWRRALSSRRVVLGGGGLILMAAICFGAMIFTANPASDFYYDRQHDHSSKLAPKLSVPWMWFGTTKLGHSLLGRCLMGGTISLSIGIAAAAISVVLGVAVGMIAGYQGGWVDATLMRAVDVLYGLPYILLIILFKIALEAPLRDDVFHSSIVANLVVLFLAIGLVSWLTMARVIRGQVLSLRAQPFIEAARALGLRRRRIFFDHLLPNLIGPITVYATLTVPQAILEESVLSFLGVGIQPPLPTWGSLASEGMMPALNPIDSNWWLLVFPCTLLALTLLCLNFVGDGLRDVFDPKRDAAKI
jgi:oligopeptide transport system permease protein